MPSSAGVSLSSRKRSQSPSLSHRVTMRQPPAIGPAMRILNPAGSEPSGYSFFGRVTAHVPGKYSTDLHALLHRMSAALEGVSRPVGRVLCARSRGAAVIHLGLPLPAASCGLPASIGRAALDRSRREPLVPLLTLLRVGFTEPPQSPTALVVSYTAVSPLPHVPA